MTYEGIIEFSEKNGISEAETNDLATSDLKKSMLILSCRKSLKEVLRDWKHSEPKKKSSSGIT